MTSPPSGARPGGGLLRGSRSLLLTGLADLWSAVRLGAWSGGEVSGLVLMVVSALCFALMAAFVKKLLPHTPIQAVVFSRGLLMTATFVAAARWQGASLVGRRTGLLMVRGLLGYLALSCYFWSVQHLPLGDAVLLQYSHPIYVALIAPLLVGERTRTSELALVAVALAGVALIVGPSGHLRPETLVGAGGAVLSALAYISVRQLSRSEHPMTILVWFPLATLPLSFVATLAAGRAALPRDGAEVAGHLLVFVSALAGQIALTHGLTRAGAARATGVTLTGPVFGLLFGYLLFDTVPTPASLAGTTIVLASLGALAWLVGRRRWNEIHAEE